MLSNLLYSLLLLAGFPTGYLLSSMCKDEIKSWRVRLSIISGISLAIAIVISSTSFEYRFPMMISLFFIIIVCLTIIWRSYNQ